MAHNDKISVVMASPQAAYQGHGGGVPAESAPPIAGMIMTPISNNSQPRTNRVQAVTVAKALKMGGISPSFLVLYNHRFGDIITLVVKYLLIFVNLAPSVPLSFEGEGEVALRGTSSL